MRSVLTMAVKDLVLITRDWLGLFFIVGFPVLMGVFFGSMYGGVGDQGSTKLDVAVVDEDGSPLSKKFVDSLSESGSVDVQKLPRDEALNRVRRGQLVGMIAIPKGFGKTDGIMGMEGPAIELGVDPSRQAEAGMLQGLIMQATGKIVMDRFQDPASMRPLIQDARDKIMADSKLSTPIRLLLNQMMTSLDGFMEKWQEVQTAEIEAGTGKGRNLPPADVLGIARIKTIDVTREPRKGSTDALIRQIRSKWDISFPQAMLWGVLACTAAFAVSIVRERKQGTLLRLQAAPVSRNHVLLGKATACFLTVLGVIVMMVALGSLLGMRPRSPALGRRFALRRLLLRRHHDSDVRARQNRGSRIGRRLGRQHDHGHVRRRHDPAGLYAQLHDGAQSGEPGQVEHSRPGGRHLARFHAQRNACALRRTHRRRRGVSRAGVNPPRCVGRMRCMRHTRRLSTRTVMRNGVVEQSLCFHS